MFVSLVVASCGRVGFDLSRDSGGAGSGGSATSRDAAVDAPTACVSDGFCVTACGAMDPDCSSVCGDHTCVANIGETCVTCGTDCKTQAAVCGNLACDPGEDGTTCPTDCGPSPWTWAQDESDLITSINQARVGGLTCPGQSSPATAPALVVSGVLRHAMHDLAWEAAQYGTVGFRRCNGQDVVTFSEAANASVVIGKSGAITPPQYLADWEQDMNGCPQIVDPGMTTIGVGIASGAANTTYYLAMH